MLRHKRHPLSSPRYDFLAVPMTHDNHNYGDPLEPALRYAARYAYALRQHGPVRVLWKDGSPVAPVAPSSH